jgi:hypothetical protein
MLARTRILFDSLWWISPRSSVLDWEMLNVRCQNSGDSDRPRSDSLDHRRKIWSQYVAFPEWSTRWSEPRVTENEGISSHFSQGPETARNSLKLAFKDRVHLELTRTIRRKLIFSVKFHRIFTRVIFRVSHKELPQMRSVSVPDRA